MRPLPLALLLSLGPAAAVGVGRFAYALVLPDMQRALDLGFAQAGLIGSANTAGYLLGALLSHRLLYALGHRRGYGLVMALQTLSLLLLALPLGLGPLLALRFVQGVAGAAVFVGGATLVLASGGRGAAAGLYYSGVGIGILLSPLALLPAGDWRAAWGMLGLLSLLLSLAAALALPWAAEPAPRSVGAAGSLRSLARPLLAYGLYGAGYIGYMTFVTSNLPMAPAPFWALLGIGAALGAALWGLWVARVGGGWGLVHVLLLLTLSSLVPLVTRVPALSAFVFGASFLGVIVAITDLFRRRLPPGAWARAMGLSTAAFALGQALGPSVSGIAGDLSGGAAGALHASSGLLAGALLTALIGALVTRRARLRGRAERPAAGHGR